MRLPIPDLSEEESEIKKIVKTMGENAKVSINIRREANDELKKLTKSKNLSEDDEKYEKIIQDYTDNNIKAIDEKVLLKERNSQYELSQTCSHNHGWQWKMGNKKKKFKKLRS